jgi:hypothetical protein
MARNRGTAGLGGYMAEFKEKSDEKQGQRRKRFLEFLRSLPMPKGSYDLKLKRWIPDKGGK